MIVIYHFKVNGIIINWQIVLTQTRKESNFKMTVSTILFVNESTFKISFQNESSFAIFCCKIRLVLGLIYKFQNTEFMDCPCVISCNSRGQTTKYYLLTLRRVQGISALPILKLVWRGFSFEFSPTIKSHNIRMHFP